MPQVLAEAPADPAAYDAAMARAPVGAATGMGAAADFFGLSRRGLGATRAFAIDHPTSTAGAGGEAGAPDLTGIDLGSDPAKLTAEEANQQFGVDGHLSFTAPLGAGEAAFKHNEVQRRIWREDVIGRANLNPLQSIGAGVAGGLLDPVGLPLMFAPELFGLRGVVAEGLAGRAAIEGGEAVVRAGRLANAGRGAVAGGAEGFASGASYEAGNYGLRRYAGEDDYSLGDSLANVLLGGVLGAGLGAAGGAFGHGAKVPRALDEAGPDMRLGAAVTALDDFVDDRPVDIGGRIEAEQARIRPSAERLRTLDEAEGEGSLQGRFLEPDTAVTTRGTEVPVRYAVVELADLVTSHTDDLSRNADYPAELQPRARERAGAQARNHALEAELNPKRLMKEAGAESGAPIVANDGVVESGNGRTIALRRSAASNGEAYAKYRQELTAQGIDTTGFKQPVLVRVRTEPMSGEARAGLAREMNADVTERMGASEQAMADAERLDDATLEGLGAEDAASQRRFATSFIGRVAPDQVNSLVGPDGRLSAGGMGRIKAALVAKAFGDQRLVEAIFESGDPNIKSIGAALVDAAPGWARMRSLAARGEIPADLDLTDALRSAVDLVRWARDNKLSVADVIADRLGQTEMFGGEAISPETEAFLRLIFRDGEFRKARSADRLGFALKDYARQASDATPGPNLFGDTADGETARTILDQLARRFNGEAEPLDAVELDLRGPGPDGNRPEPIDLRPPSERGAEGAGGGKPAGEVAAPEPVRRVFPANDAADVIDIAEASHEIARGDMAAALQRFPVDQQLRALDDFVVVTMELARKMGLADNRRMIRIQDYADDLADAIEGRGDTSKEFALARMQKEYRRVAEEYPPLMQQLAHDWATAMEDKAAEPSPPAPGVADAPAAKPDPIASDPVLKLLSDDTEALAAAHGVDLPAPKPNEDPATLAEALRAAAICLATEIEP